MQKICHVVADAHGGSQQGGWWRRRPLRCTGVEGDTVDETDPELLFAPSGARVDRLAARTGEKVPMRIDEEPN